MKSMKKIIILCLAAGCFVGCGIHKPYTRPEVETAGLYGDVEGTAEEETIADLKWQELFTDTQLQSLIELGLKVQRRSSYRNLWCKNKLQSVLSRLIVKL